MLLGIVFSFYSLIKGTVALVSHHLASRNNCQFDRIENFSTSSKYADIKGYYMRYV